MLPRMVFPAVVKLLASLSAAILSTASPEPKALRRSEEESSTTFAIWKETFGDSSTSRVLSSLPSFSLKVQIIPDAFPDEITWTVGSFDGIVIRPILHRDKAESASALVTPGSYTFEITDASGDGLCCAFGLGLYRLTVNDQTVFLGGEFGPSTGILDFVVNPDGSVDISGDGNGGMPAPTVPTPPGQSPSSSPVLVEQSNSPTDSSQSNVDIFRTELLNLISTTLVEFSPVSFDLAVEWYANNDPAYDQPDYDPSIPEWRRPHFLQRFILIWLWFHSTDNGNAPWRSCNPAGIDETDDCILDNLVAIDRNGEPIFNQEEAIRYMASTSECEWVHVGCFEGTREVRILTFSANLMSGRFPVFLVELPSLVQLVSILNALTGTLPPQIGGFSELISLELAGNQLTGTLPNELFSLTNLRFLILGLNQLEGEIPSEIGVLRNLGQVDLSRNNFSGRLPTELGLLSSASDLRFQDNFVSGTIPFEIGRLNDLSLLWLNENFLRGTIPHSIGALTNLRSLNLAQNQLEGPIPQLFMPFLETLVIFGNFLSGEIPETLYGSTGLIAMSIAGNFLTSTISTQVGNLQNLEFFAVDDNMFTGSIPPELGGLSSLSFVTTFFNFFQGPIVEAICARRVPFGALQTLATDCGGRVPLTECNCCTLCCDASLRDSGFSEACAPMEMSSYLTSKPQYELSTAKHQFSKDQQSRGNSDAMSSLSSTHPDTRWPSMDAYDILIQRNP